MEKSQKDRKNQLESEASQYELSDLKAHIEKRKDNIQIFEDAIQKEKDGIERELKMIAFLESR